MVAPLFLVAKVRILHLFQMTLLLWPFNLFIPSARQLQRVCHTLAAASTLFVFRMRQIVAEREAQQRFERAMRLISEQLSIRRPYGRTVAIVSGLAL